MPGQGGIRFSYSLRLLRLSWAWWLCCVAFKTSVGQAQQNAAKRVSGRVVNAQDGRPIPHASLSLQETKTDKVVTETTSDAEGGFRFEPVSAGRYRLAGRAKGYPEAAYLQHGLLSSAVVTGAGLATEGLLLQLTASALLQGRVLSEVGEPVARATVSLYRENSPATTATTERMARVRSTQTGEDGRYEFRNLTEGPYFLTATGTPWYAVHAPEEAQTESVPYRTAVDPALDMAYPTIYYPGALRSEQASALSFRGGEEVTADLRMVPVPAVTLTLQQATATGRNRSFPILTRSIFGVDEPVPIQGIFSNGSQQISGLAPGEYAVEQGRAGNRSPARLQTIDVTSGSTAVTLSMASPDLVAVSVQVQALPGTALPSGMQMNLRDLRKGRRFASSKVDEKGAVAFTDVPAGEYRPVLLDGGHPLAFVTLAVSGKPVPDRRLRVTGAEPVSAPVVVSGEPVTVTGGVEHDGKPAVGVLVILVPAGTGMGEDLFRREQTDLDGGFTLPDVDPGNYIAVAVEDGFGVPWTDLARVSKYLLHGVPLTVKAGTEQSAMRLQETIQVQPK